MLHNRYSRGLIAIVSFTFLFGCATNKGASTLVSEKTLLRECDRGWVSYKVYMLPEPIVEKSSKRQRKQESKYLRFCIMVINKDGMGSPLRYICSNKEQYDSYYEYLLNGAKNDLILVGSNSLNYPIYYAFENNYNAFPFETINVGYRVDGKLSRRELKNYEFLYLDRVFSHDTLKLDLSRAQL